MSNKKRNQILAALLCATTMATFYGSPKAEAADAGAVNYVANESALQVDDGVGNKSNITNLKLGDSGTLTSGEITASTKLTVGAVTLTGGALTGVTDITADKATIGTTTIDSTGIAVGTNMKITEGGISNDQGFKINGVEFDKSGAVTAAGGFTVNKDNYLNEDGLKASAATIGGDIEATGTLKGSSLEITGQSLTLNGKVLTDAKIEHINNTVTGDKEVDASKGLTLGNTLVKTTGNIEGDTIKATEYTIDGDNSWTSAQLKAGTAVIGGNTTINSIGIDTNKVTLGNMDIVDGAITDDNGVVINGVELKGDKVTAANGFSVNDNNSLKESGLTASAADISGELRAAGGNFIANASGTTTTGTATFTNNGSTTTISGGTITADTLKVDQIILGKGSSNGSGPTDIVIGADGAFSAAGGNFKITGGEGDDRGAITNKVGNTSFETTADGITSTATDGNSNSSTSTITGTEITNKSGVASSTITGGNNANITNTVGEEEATKSVMTENSITDTVGKTTVTTTTDGMEIAGTGGGMKVDTSTGTVTFKGHNDPIVTGGVTETTINGNTITTGQITTDKLVITGNGQADDKGNGGSIAMGGDGSIVSNIKDGNNETKFQTTVEGISGTVTDGTNTTKTSTKATGTTTTVTAGSNETGIITGATGTTTTVTDGTNNANSNVSADKIENSVNSNAVTIGTDGITSKVGDTTSQTIGKESVTTKVGDFQSELKADGMTITDGTLPNNSTKLTSGDVSIKTDAYDISLSEMGQIKEIDGELQGRGEYKDTVVSGLNAEAAIRREEVARLDNRIDQTNERLDRVGAMAAAAASLKSMGYDPAAPTEFAMGVGTYKGSQAIAVGLFHYPNRDFMLNINYTQSAGEKMGGVGATWKFGRKNPDKVLDDQLKERQKKVKIAQEKAAAAAQLAKEADERAAYAARQAQHAKTQAATAYRDAEKAYLERESK